MDGIDRFPDMGDTFISLPVTSTCLVDDLFALPVERSEMH